jgi:hypothetical protein
MARSIAKQVVAATLARRCTVDLADDAGVSNPEGVRVDTHGTGGIHWERIASGSVNPRGPEIDHVKQQPDGDLVAFCSRTMILEGFIRDGSPFGQCRPASIT